MKVVMAKAAADLVESGYSAQAAAEQAIRVLGERTSGAGGLIVVDRAGGCGAAFSTPTMVWGLRTRTDESVHA
jgi:isoaspartyl peptidase/L-asparaginase-like protein (Ntn-hydrolase superfamily)